MSRLYEVAVLSPATATITGPLAVATIVAGATQADVREICILAQSATVGGDIQFGRPAAAGTGTATGTLVQACNPDDQAGLATLVPNNGFATTQPTAPAVATRQWRQVGSVSAGLTIVWEPGELIIPAAGQFVIWMVAGTGAYDVYVKVCE